MLNEGKTVMYTAMGHEWRELGNLILLDIFVKFSLILFLNVQAIHVKEDRLNP